MFFPHALSLLTGVRWSILEWNLKNWIWNCQNCASEKMVTGVISLSKFRRCPKRDVVIIRTNVSNSKLITDVLKKWKTMQIRYLKLKVDQRDSHKFRFDQRRRSQFTRMKFLFVTSTNIMLNNCNKAFENWNLNYIEPGHKKVDSKWTLPVPTAMTFVAKNQRGTNRTALRIATLLRHAC